MPFVMVQMRDVLERFPDAGDGFRRDIEAIEANVEAHPHLGLGLARELLQSCCNTIERERGDTIDHEAPLPQRAKKLIDRIVFGFAGHPDQKAIEEHLTALVGSLNGAVRALSQLSNIPGLRHGGDANWSGPTRRHAMLLAGAVDALSAFLFESHRAEILGGQQPEPSYDAEAEFNAEFDDAWPVEFADYRFNASEVLFALDREAYRAEVAGWKANRPAGDEEAEAS
jgi:hypothetical protein